MCPDTSCTLSDTPRFLPVTVSGICQSVGMGRRRKGDRDFIGVRPPQELGTLVRQQAQRRGMTVNDYVSGVLAEHEGMSHLIHTAHNRDQGELPLTG